MPNSQNAIKILLCNVTAPRQIRDASGNHFDSLDFIQIIHEWIKQWIY